MAKSDLTAFTAAVANNPLIQPSSLPFGAPEFDKVKTEHYEPALDWALKGFMEEVDEIKANPKLPTFKNTIEALEYVKEDLDRLQSLLEMVSLSNSNDGIRALEDVFDAKITPALSDVSMDDTLFAKIKAVYDDKNNLNLSASELMLLENTYKSRVRSGALLEAGEKDRFKAIETKLSQLSTKFGQNAVAHKATFEWIVSENDLIGVPERATKTFKAGAEAAIKLAEEKGDSGRVEALKDNYLVTLSPSSGAIMSHCENRDMRQIIHQADGRIGTEGEYDNRPLILEMVALRDERASILGYESHAAFVLEDRMAGSLDTVETFLDKNLNTYKPEAEKYFNGIKDFALASGDIDSFEQYDFGFYSRQLKEQVMSFDEELLRPYFEVSNVVDGFFRHIEKLFNVKMVDCTDKYPAYRDDAKVYEVLDNESGAVKALFYADYFAEEGVKKDGAWMTDLREYGIDRHGVENIPIVTNSCNFEKPSKDNPSLLSLRDVTTVFHEGGHAFHAILGTGPYASLNGVNVPWDFVEFPSQIQENWAMEPEVLKSFAVHNETGDVIPDEYVQKIQDMATYGAAMQGLAQTKYGMLDIYLHTISRSDLSSVEAVEDVIHDKTSFWAERSGLMLPSFGHLFSGEYDSSYYSYKWAEGIDADGFGAFKENGLYDPDTAEKLREMYSQGGNRNPMDLYVEFRGREPDPDAMFRREGVTAPEASGGSAVSAPKPSPF